MTDSQLLLTEIADGIRDLRRDFTNFSLNVTSRIAALEQSNKDLAGNGRPGRVTLLETRVDVLERDHDEEVGAKKRERLWHMGYSGAITTFIVGAFKVAGAMGLIAK